MDDLLDRDAAREMAADCGWTLAQLASFYMEGAAAELAELEAAVADGALDEVARLAHGCKGSSGSVGVVGMSSAYAELEDAAKDGQSERLAPLLAAVRARFALLPRAFADAERADP